MVYVALLLSINSPCQCAQRAGGMENSTLKIPNTSGFESEGLSLCWQLQGCSSADFSW